MTTMVAELYDALRDAQGVSDDKARRAAEAMADYDDRFKRLERRMDALQAKLERKIEALRAEMNLLRWMSATSIGLGIANLIKLFTH